MRGKPPFPPYVEACEYLDDLVQRRNARLSVMLEEGGFWRAHIEWNDGHPVHPILGYTGWGLTQNEATFRLAEAVRDDRENVRP